MTRDEAFQLLVKGLGDLEGMLLEVRVMPTYDGYAVVAEWGDKLHGPEWTRISRGIVTREQLERFIEHVRSVVQEGKL